MRSAVAFSSDTDSLLAAHGAAAAALATLGSAADLALVFATVQHDLAAIRTGLRQALGNGTRLVVGGAVGAITNEAYGYAGYQLGLALIALDHTRLTLLSAGDLDEGEHAVGETLGKQLHRTLADNPEQAVILLYDSKSVRSGRGKLNMATPLLAGMRRQLGNLPPLAGAGLIGDMSGSPMPQLIDDAICSQQAIALAFHGGIQMDSIILHGCQPGSDYFRITRADGNLLYELDGRPVLDVISELLGHTVPPEEFGFFVTLGVNQGDKWAPYDESAYMNRLCLKADLKRQALLMFEPDLCEGTEVQLMIRNLELDYIRPKVESLFARMSGRKPVLALYINCAGRAAAYSGQDREDAEIVQQAVAGRVPLLGFYSGVEIGEVMGRPMPLDWTGVFCLLSERDEG